MYAIDEPETELERDLYASPAVSKVDDDEDWMEDEENWDRPSDEQDDDWDDDDDWDEDEEEEDWEESEDEEEEDWDEWDDDEPELESRFRRILKGPDEDGPRRRNTGPDE